MTSPEDRSNREDLRDIKRTLARIDEKLDRQADRFDRALAALNERLDSVNARQDILIDGLAQHIAQRHEG